MKTKAQDQKDQDQTQASEGGGGGGGGQKPIGERLYQDSSDQGIEGSTRKVPASSRDFE